MDPQLKKRLTRSIAHLACPDTWDGYSAKPFQPAVALSCYIYGRTTIVTNLQGEKLASQVTVIISGELQIGHFDEFKFAEGGIYGGWQLLVKAFDYHDELHGEGITRVYL